MTTRPPTEDDRTFTAERGRLLGLAYRILGSRTEAEDVVQDAWLRWQRADPATIDHPAAWLTTVTSRLALDRLGSAQRRRETYVGPWLPEPVVAGIGEASDPAETVELQESLTLGFLTVLERLAPVERVVFLLADVFGVPFDEIAETVGRSPAACRQVASRARQRVRAGRPRFRPTDAEAWQATAAFFAATAAGDVDGLVQVLSPDVVVLSDGGPDHHAARRPVVGPQRVARYLLNLASRRPDMEVEPVLVNGEPGCIIRTDGQIEMVLSVQVEGALIVGLHVVVNPAKFGAVESRAGFG
jgi:RNA polymerase sigma-70 factor (ECF subfamily)